MKHSKHVKKLIVFFSLILCFSMIIPNITLAHGLSFQAYQQCQATKPLNSNTSLLESTSKTFPLLSNESPVFTDGGKQVDSSCLLNENGSSIFSKQQVAESTHTASENLEIDSSSEQESIMSINETSLYAKNDVYSGSLAVNYNSSTEDPWGGGSLNYKLSHSVDPSVVIKRPVNILKPSAWIDAFTKEFTATYDLVFPEEITFTSPNDFMNKLNQSNSKFKYRFEGKDKEVTMNIIEEDVVIDAIAHNKVRVSINATNQPSGIISAITDIIWDLITLLASWFTGGKAPINIELYLDFSMDKLMSQGYKSDVSKEKVITKGKLPPHKEKQLAFSGSLYSYDKATKLDTRNSTISTWREYVSPWNANYAQLERTGKNDDTTTDGTFEVTGQNRVLQGTNYKLRQISLLETDIFLLTDGYRIVDFFDRTANTNIADASVDNSVNTEQFIQNTPKFKELEKTSKYKYSHLSKLLSPITLTTTSRKQLGIDYFNSQTGEISTLPNKAFTMSGNVNLYGFKKLKLIPEYLDGATWKALGSSIEINREYSDVTLPFHITIENGLPKPNSGTSYQARIRAVRVEQGASINLETVQNYTITIKDSFISLGKVSPSLNFGTIKVSGKDKITPLIEPFSLEIIDYINAGWLLQAQATPFVNKQDYGDVLQGDIIWRTKNGTDYSLHVPTVIYQSAQGNTGQHNIIDLGAQNTEGFLLNSATHLKNINKVYQSEITFTLTIAVRDDLLD